MLTEPKPEIGITIEAALDKLKLTLPLFTMADVTGPATESS